MSATCIVNVYSSILLIYFFHVDMCTYFSAAGNFDTLSLGSRLSVMGPKNDFSKADLISSMETWWAFC